MKSQSMRVSLAMTMAGLIGTFVATGATLAQAQTEVVYATFLDPANKNDPRSEAQTRIIEAFEKANPGIKVRVLIDTNQQTTLRALRTKSNSPDAFRVNNFNAPEFVATGSVLALDDLIARDKFDMKDWLLPLDAAKIGGKLYGMQQDFRIPVLLYRKGMLEKAGIKPPRTYDEVCESGTKLSTLGNVVGYAVPLGTSGGPGGAQAFAELMFSSMATETTGKYFAPDGREMIIDRDQLLKTLQMVKDLYGKCGTTSKASIQFGYNEVHDGLRAGNVAMSNFGLYRFRAVQSGGAGDDLGWAPAPAFKADGKLVTYGYTAAVNANASQKEAAWQFIRFLGSPEAQAIAAEAGEVVARASVYETSPHFKTPDGERQKQWSQFIRERGQFVSYSVALTTFHQVLGEAAQRMILRNGSAEDARSETEKGYKEALAKIAN